jgi:streptogramin lyase
MSNQTRKSDRRRVTSRQARPFASQALPRRMVEGLETRCLMTVAINEFGGSIAPQAPAGITAGPDGNLWFTEANPTGGAIDRITPSGSIERFTTGLSPLAIPTGITTGPDGALWFTEFGANALLGLPVGGASKIGRIDPNTGQITEFSNNLTPNSGPDQITLGSDGNLWFTENKGNKIGRITPQGQITEFSTGLSPNSQPVGITAGPAGTLWFAESNTDLIGRITTDGVITEFGQGIIPNNSAPTGIALGSDGNLWFTEIGSKSNPLGGIGRITPSGTITQFIAGLTPGLTPASGPAGITSGPDGALYFTEQVSGRVGRITTQGTVNEFTQGYAPTNGPAQITQGPDGNLWFTELGTTQNPGSHVDRITTVGVVTQFPSPNAISPNAAPRGITAGPDGALWFTETGLASSGPGAGNTIGRIDTSGQITEFSQGIPAGAIPFSITTGPDGNLWFTEAGSSSGGNVIQLGAIGRITPQGVVTQFSAGLTSSSVPQDITLGPDGNLWFTDAGDDAIGRITPQGVITEFSQGITPGGFPVGIATGPDGNLWFTVDHGISGPSTVDRITTQGVVTEFTIPTMDAGPTDIAAGPNNDLFFTEEVAGKLGRITTSGVITELAPSGPVGLNQPDGVVLGPDKQIYFVEYAGNKVDRLNADGSFTRIPIPSAGSFPLVMAVGSDKNLWFTESFNSSSSSSSQIGQVILPQTSVVAQTGSPGNTFQIASFTGQPISFAFPFFRDTSPAANATNFAASIDFGDGQVVPGVVSPPQNGTFIVSGMHTYANPGVYQASVTIFNQAGQAVPIPFTVTVTKSTLTFVVTNTDDSGPGSLRQVILNANQVGGHSITFAIPGAAGSVQTITPRSPLPMITGPTVVDGGSQGVAGQPAATPLIQIDGRNAGAGAEGLVFGPMSGGSQLIAISVFGFQGNQVELDSGGDVIQGNYLGLPADSSTPSGFVSGADGLLIKAGDEIIGGTLPFQRNIISGNMVHGIEFFGPAATHSIVLGNYIGTDPTGSSALANLLDGVVIANGASGVFVGPNNVISGNGNIGVELIGTSGNLILGDRIGTNASGTKAIGNGDTGICVDLGSSNNTVGGSIAGATNVISGNGMVGVAVRGKSTGNLIQANLIGTDLAGDAAIGNGIAGVLISDSSRNVVGPSNLVSGNGSRSQGAGIWIDGPGATNNMVFGNRIGTNLAGDASLGNEIIGVLVNEGSGNLIGGTFAGASNLISGNTSIGVMLAGPGASANMVEGNLIGTDASGLKKLGNGTTTDGAGVYLENAPGNVIGGASIGMGNVISGNAFDGVQIFGPGSSGNLFQGNKIGTDVSGTLPLGNGGAGLLVNEAPGTRIVANLIDDNALSGIMLSGAGASSTLIQANLIGVGMGGQPLGNRGFGLLIANGAPTPIQLGNVNLNNTLGPIRDLNNTSTSSIATAATKSAKSAKTKASATHIRSKKASFGSRPMAKLHARGHARPKK